MQFEVTVCLAVPANTGKKLMKKKFLQLFAKKLKPILSKILLILSIQ